MDRTEKIIRSLDWVRDPAASDWCDGMLVGNGLIGVPSFARDSFEFIVNANDIFDGRETTDYLLPYSEVMKKYHSGSDPSVCFLNDYDRRKPQAGINGSQNDTVSAVRLKIRFGHGLGWSAPAAPYFRQELSLYDGVLRSFADAHLFHVKSVHFVPHGRRLLALRISNCGGGSVVPGLWERPSVLEIVRPPSDILDDPEWQMPDGRTLMFTQELPCGKAHYTFALRLIPSDEKTISSTTGKIGGRMVLMQPEFDLFASTASSYSTDDTQKQCLSELDNAEKIGFDALLAENSLWWHDFWQKSYAYFDGKEEIQRYYTFSLYEIGSTFGGVPVPGLNGLAYGPIDPLTAGVGCSGYTHDQNAQIPCMPCLMHNHLEYFDQLADTYIRMLPALKKHTCEVYEKSGAMLPLGTNQLGDPMNAGEYRYTLCGAAFTGWLLAMRWHFYPEKEYFSERMLPLLKEFAAYYLDSMTPESDEPDAKYVLDWNVPPEIFRISRNDNATLALLKKMLTILLEACRKYDCEAELSARIEDLLDRYPEFNVHPEGNWWCGRDIPFDHYMYGGHLYYPFFPSEADIDISRALKTIDYMANYGVEKSFADLEVPWHHDHAWSWFWTNVTRQRCGGAADKCWEEFDRFIRYFGKANGLFTHNPVIIADPVETEKAVADHPPLKLRSFDDGEIIFPQNDGQCVTANSRAKEFSPAVVEGNSIFAFALSESLLQCWNGSIDVFPGVEKNFSGWFKNFLIPPGVEISAEMICGKTVSCSLNALNDAELTLKFSDRENVEKLALRSGEKTELIF